LARNSDLSPRHYLTSKYLLGFSGEIVALAGNFTEQILARIERDVHHRAIGQIGDSANKTKPCVAFVAFRLESLSIRDIRAIRGSQNS
jgi:hypothetical protein